MKRRVFQWFTVGIAIACSVGVWENVVSNDDAVRKLARSTVNQAAGCNDNCKMTGLTGDRGMLSETIAYDLRDHGHWVVACKRAFVVIGDYTCAVTEPGTGPSPATSASAK